jgi:hypothetical protein
VWRRGNNVEKTMMGKTISGVSGKLTNILYSTLEQRFKPNLKWFGQLLIAKTGDQAIWVFCEIFKPKSKLAV